MAAFSLYQGGVALLFGNLPTNAADNPTYTAYYVTQMDQTPSTNIGSTYSYINGKRVTRSGWTVDGKNLVDPDTMTLTADTTFYAVYTQHHNYWSDRDYNHPVEYNNVWTDGTELYYSNGGKQLKFNGTGWEPISWPSTATFSGSYVWTDGTNIYYSNGSGKQYRLNGTTWEPMTWKWQGLSRSLQGNYIWTDGTNIYYSEGSYQYRLNDTTWEPMTWNGLTSFTGQYVWTEGTNIYYSYNADQYRLNGTTWEPMTWNSLTSFIGQYVWTVGTNTYYSYNAKQYRLNGTTWEPVTWNGLPEYNNGAYIWTDGTDTYYSNGSDKQYRINGTTWEPMTWTGLTEFKGHNIWKDGTNIYYSSGADQYRLNGTTWEPLTFTYSDTKLDSEYIWADGTNIYYSAGSTQYRFNGTTWKLMTWTGLTEFRGYNIWTDGTNIYYSYGNDQYRLNGTKWEPMTWNGITNFDNSCIWSDGTKIYFSYHDSNRSDHYQLNGTTWEPMTWDGFNEFNGNFIWTDGTNIYYSKSDSQYQLDGTTWKKWKNADTRVDGNNVWTDSGRFFTSVNCRPYRGVANELGNIYHSYNGTMKYTPAPVIDTYYSVGTGETFTYNGSDRRAESSTTKPAWYTDDMTVNYYTLRDYSNDWSTLTPLTEVKNVGSYVAVATQTDGDIQYIQLHSYRINISEITYQLNYTDFVVDRPIFPTVDFFTADGEQLTLDYEINISAVDFAGMRQKAIDEGLTDIEDLETLAGSGEFFKEYDPEALDWEWQVGVNYYIGGVSLSGDGHNNYDLASMPIDESKYPNYEDYDLTTLMGYIDYYEAYYNVMPHFTVVDAFAADVNTYYNGAEQTLAELNPAWLDDSITIVSEPTMRDAGEYKVLVKKDDATQEIKVNILPKTITANIVGDGWTVGSSEQLPTGLVVGFFAGDDVNYTVKYYNDKGDEVVNFPVGTYIAKVVLSGADANNYAIAGTVEKAFKVVQPEVAEPNNSNTPTVGGTTGGTQQTDWQWLGWAVIGGIIILGGSTLAFLAIKLRNTKFRSARA